MNKTELQRYLGITGSNLVQVEKDYCQHIILSAISRDLGADLVFKGGTALQKTGITRRFSEDLDFTANGNISSSRLQNTVLKVISAYNFQATILEPIENDRAISFKIRIQGPLYTGAQSFCKISLEISKRETILLGSRLVQIDPLYLDIIPYVLETMFTREMAAEKVRAIITRNKPRDLYDLFMILRQGGTIDTVMADKKLHYYDKSFDTIEFLKKCKIYNRTWIGELEQLVDDVPDFKVVYRTIAKSLPSTQNRKNKS